MDVAEHRIFNLIQGRGDDAELSADDRAELATTIRFLSSEGVLDGFPMHFKWTCEDILLTIATVGVYYYLNWRRHGPGKYEMHRFRIADFRRLDLVLGEQAFDTRQGSQRLSTAKATLWFGESPESTINLFYAGADRDSWLQRLNAFLTQSAERLVS